MTATLEFGGFASEVLGLTVDITDDSRALGLDALAGVALRRNPRRAHLIVSRVLAKHIPVPGRSATEHGHMLGDAVAPLVRGSGRVVVVGFCETATGLGHLVAERLEVPYVHTTRDERDGAPVWLRFEEPHSHAPAHLLLQQAAHLVSEADVVVLVDDELSTGTTALNLVEAIDALAPGKRYVLAALLDLRRSDVRAALRDRAHGVGIELDCVSLVSGTAAVADDAVGRAEPLVAAASLPTGGGDAPGAVDVLRLQGAPSGRVGALPGEQVACVARAAWWLRERVTDPSRLLVVGTEEMMFLPIKIAAQMGCDVQSTSRSPVVVGAFDDTYPIRSGVTFPSCYDQATPAYLYNGLGEQRDGHRYDDVVVVTDQITADSGVLAGPGGLFSAVAAAGARLFVIVCGGDGR